MTRYTLVPTLTLFASIAAAQPATPSVPAPPTVAWSALDAAGQKVSVPAADRPTLVLFIMADQPQSRQALEQVPALAAKAGSLQLIAVISGDQAKSHAAKLAQDKTWPGPVVADVDYAIANQMGVRVWPTTEIVSASGARVEHLPGFPKSYAHDLAAYLAFALGKIDAATLQKQLDEHATIADTAQEAAHRHLLLAQQLLEHDRLDQARAELESGLKLAPKDPALLLTLADLHVRTGQPDQAQALADALPPDAAPAWRLQLLRGKVMIVKGQWDKALDTLTSALKLNPEPAQTHYLIGLVQQHQGRWQEAAQAFRAAFEATPAGQHGALPASQ